MKPSRLAGLFLFAATASLMLSVVSSKDEPANEPVAVNVAMAPQDEMPGSVDEVIIWSAPTEKAKSGCEREIVLQVEQKDGWHIYSQTLAEGGIYVPTSFKFKPSSAYKLVGSVKEPKTEVVDNEGFPERAFDQHHVKFSQKIEVLTTEDFELEMEVEFMACKTACFPPDTRTWKVKVKGCSSASSSVVPEVEGDTTEEAVEPADGADTAMMALGESIKSPVGWKFFGVKDKEGENFQVALKVLEAEGWKLLGAKKSAPLELSLPEGVKATLESTPELDENDLYSAGEFVWSLKGSDLEKLKIKGELNFKAISPEGTTYQSETKEMMADMDKSVVRSIADSGGMGTLWGIFFKAFIMGLLALLTPCVFPMIPLTVSFFTKGSENRRAGIAKGITYGLFIMLIYVLLSVPFHVLEGLKPNILNAISTNVVLNIIFFVMLFVFGISFLGAFEITLPSGLANKSDKASNAGGLIGVFFMALTLAIVSFSCTGPVLGLLLADAASASQDVSDALQSSGARIGGGGAWGLTVGMLGFGIALGLPFALFAIFPSMMSSLPKSGGWLNVVKVTLGFIELAFAFKFLNVADVVDGHAWFTREMFLGVWIALFGALAMYLFGLYRTKHDSPNEGIGAFRLLLATFTLGFTLYMLPGLWGAPLNLIAAFPPTKQQAEWQWEKDLMQGAIGVSSSDEGVEVDSTLNPYDFGAKTGPSNLPVFEDYYEGLEFARRVGKPLMIDFTGHACVNCRLMEMNVWSKPSVLPLLRSDVVIAALHADEKTMLPEAERSGDIETVGDKWSDFQMKRYGKNSQPQYVLLDSDEELLNTDASYSTHGEEELFHDWLQTGLKEFQKRKGIEAVYPEISPLLGN